MPCQTIFWRAPAFSPYGDVGRLALGAALRPEKRSGQHGLEMRFVDGREERIAARGEDGRMAVLAMRQPAHERGVGFIKL